MKKTFTFLMLVSLLLWGESRGQTACTLGNYQSAALLGPSSFPFFSSGTGITVSISAPGVPTLGNSSYACGGQTFACASPTWWQNSTGHIITVNFSAPIAKFSVVINGTNQGEVLTFTGNAGTTTLSDYCTAGFSTLAPNQLIDNIVPATGTLITVNNSTGATSYVISHNGTGSGSRISLLDCFVAAAPFDVRYGDFTADYRPELQDVKLRWETQTENNARGFEVQHSTDGEVWDALGFVDAVGNSSSLHPYDFVHVSPVEGPNYYRLRQVDRDANYSFSEVRTLHLESRGMEATIFPNPSTGRFEVRAMGRKGSLEVTDLVGRSVLQHSFDSQLQLDLVNEASGVYLVKITDQHSRTTSQRLVIQ